MDAHHDPFAASAPRLHALGATAQAELAHVRARPELAALDVRAGGVPNQAATGGRWS